MPRGKRHEIEPASSPTRTLRGRSTTRPPRRAGGARKALGSRSAQASSRQRARMAGPRRTCSASRTADWSRGTGRRAVPATTVAVDARGLGSRAGHTAPGRPAGRDRDPAPALPARRGRDCAGRRRGLRLAAGGPARGGHLRVGPPDLVAARRRADRRCGDAAAPPGPHRAVRHARRRPRPGALGGARRGAGRAGGRGRLPAAGRRVRHHGARRHAAARLARSPAGADGGHAAVGAARRRRPPGRPGPRARPRGLPRSPSGRAR